MHQDDISSNLAARSRSDDRQERSLGRFYMESAVILRLAGKRLQYKTDISIFLCGDRIAFLLLPEKDSPRCKMLNFDSTLRGRFWEPRYGCSGYPPTRHVPPTALAVPGR